MSSIVPGIVTSWFLGTCWPLAPCSKPVPPGAVTAVAAPQTQVIIHQTLDNNHSALVEQRYQQVQNIGLGCEQSDLTINYLEQLVGTAPQDPEYLNNQQRRLNSAARTKIWQLRTYCR